ncbi:heterokaryon incompatibility protein-domain-containing protein, partial [Xylogone sp. PMI_703]
MRLLEWSGNGQLRLTRDLPPDQIPKYAILSHTWGPDEEEVTFEDLKNNLGKDKSGYEKIRFCGKQARRDGLQFFWVDTCCIDKTNNAELAEAINSMFRWYRDADKCYVYLSDVSTMGHDRVRLSLQSWQPAFIGSRWFTRGWTLQELIAPLSVEFFDSNGQRLGDKQSLERQLHDITGIATSALQGAPLSGFSVKDKMSWTANRQTKRAEDRAYSLLGIFDVSMATIYGEGAEKAFERLRNELYTRSKTRQLSELSSVSDTFTPTNRHKSLDTSLYSVPSHLAPNFANNEPSSTLQFPIYSGNINHGIDAATKRLLINQFYFTKIDERLTNLTAAQGTTCRWFLAKAEYISWHDPTAQSDHGGFLWIKGNPGTGKSTLMKFLFEETKLNTKHDSSQITLSFFFLAQAIGLYRSSLHQLFEKAVDLEDSLEWMTTDGARVILRNGWHEGALKQTLLHAVEKLGNRSLTIFIDALDECRQNQVTDMICFFEELCNCAKEKEVRLKICFSSRHYPTVVIQRGIEVTLEDETGHIEDIKQYIESKSRLGKSKQAESLRSEILEKSSNIFLWVVLVLDILNSEYAHNTISLKKMRECLKEIPAKLTDLFEMILVQHGDNLEQLHVCLKLILFAARPLKPQELYFAINLSLDKEFSGYWDQEDVELDQIKTFVRSSSKGLAEITRNKASEVQFIHESVRDALLGQYQGQLLETSNNLVGYSHELLRD